MTNCAVESVAKALKIGTASHANFCDALLFNRTIRTCGLSVGVYLNDGGTAERVTFSYLSIVTMGKAEECAR